jgi:hypothetical protein
MRFYRLGPIEAGCDEWLFGVRWWHHGGFEVRLRWPVQFIRWKPRPTPKDITDRRRSGRPMGKFAAAPGLDE